MFVYSKQNPDEYYKQNASIETTPLAFLHNSA